MQLELNANANSVESPPFTNHLGFLAITVSPHVYLSINGAAFTPPTQPPPFTLPANASNAKAATMGEQHKLAKSHYQLYTKTDAALKQILLAAVSPVYLLKLKHHITGYARTTARELVSHLYLTYGRITTAALLENNKCMHTPYDPTCPIEFLFRQVSDARDFADAGEPPYTDTQLVNITYQLLFNTGKYNEASREWRKKKKEDKIINSW